MKKTVFFLFLFCPLLLVAQNQYMRMTDIFEDRIYAHLTAADIDADGDLDMLFTTTVGHLGWLENTGTGEFSDYHLIPSAYRFGFEPKAVDMDNDGDLDIVVNAKLGEVFNGSGTGTGFEIESQLGWFKNENNGNDFGNFNPLTTVELSGFSDFEITDFDGNNMQDIITVSNVNQSLILLTDPDQDGFFESTFLDSTDWRIKFIEIVDFDNDGDLDIVTLSRLDGGEKVVSWHEQLVSGDFEKHIFAQYPNIVLYLDMEINDFDADGFMDIMLGGIGRINFLYSDSTILSHNETIYRELEAYSLHSGDFDGDGDIDAVGSDFFYKNIDNTRDFESIHLYPGLVSIFGVVIEDFDGDSFLDMYSSGSEDGSFNQHEQTNNSQVFEYIGRELGYSPQEYFIGDFDGDSDRDVAAVLVPEVLSLSTWQLVWYENTDGVGHFSAPELIESDISSFVNLEVMDVNNDGYEDIMYYRTDSLFAYLYNPTLGHFDPLKFVFTNSGMLWHLSRFGDINGDGLTDFVSKQQSGPLEVHFYDPDIERFKYEYTINGFTINDFELADFDTDGDIDIVFRNSADNFGWSENINNTSWLLHYFGGVIASSSYFNLTDLNGDDLLDITYRISEKLHGFLSEDSLGVYGESTELLDSLGSGLILVDVDSDNDIDFSSNSHHDIIDNQRMVWYENLNGKGVFSTYKDLPIFSDRYEKEDRNVNGQIADIDGDGVEDMVGISLSARVLTWYKSVPANAYPIAGKIYLDTTLNCTATDTASMGLGEWIVVVERSDGLKYHALTDAEGNYVLNADTGEYKVNVVLPNNYYYHCSFNTPITVVPSADTIPLSLGVSVGTECPLMDVDIQTSNLRPCLPAFQTVFYCNEGTALAEDVSIEVTFDNQLEVTGSSIPWVTQNGQTYTFEVDDLEPGDCGSFTITSIVDCDAQFGDVNCATARVFPDTICNFPALNWDGSNIVVGGRCENDTVVFKIQNTGTGNMANPLDYIVQIVNDDIIMFFEIDTFQLGAGDSTLVTVPAQGLVMKMQAEQSPNNPVSMSDPIAVIPNCDSLNIDSLFVLLNQFPMGNGDPFSDHACLPVTGSYDPNDKQAFPSGIGPNHLVEPDWEIEYLIRFQNTGTDTAFTVVIRDTLSPHLNPSTVRPGAASHPYSWELTGTGALSFTFDNILLPDSNTNEALSHGYVSFKIEQEADIVPGTVFENTAFIYFDFNDPVQTNTTFHEVIKHVVYEIEFLEFCGETDWGNYLIAHDTIIADTTVMVEYDSVTLFDVQVHDEYFFTFDTLLHQWEMWNGQFFNMDTSLVDSTLTIFDCDSIIVNQINSISLVYSDLEVMICEGDAWNEVVYLQDTVLIDTLWSTIEDTIFTTDLIVEEVYETTIDTMLPYGEPYFSDTTFILFFTAFNGCDSIVTLNIDVTVNAKEIFLDNASFIVQPNPTVGLLTCYFEKISPVITSVSLLNVTGQELENRPVARSLLPGSPLQLDIGGFPPGLYLLKLKTEEGIFVKKIVRSE